MPLSPGDKAPDFTLPDQRGRLFTLTESIERTGAPHLVYFYPKADTPGCTQQACGIRDVQAGAGAGAGVVVVGISPDPPPRQARFDAKYGLGFPLLSDPDHEVAEGWGAWGKRSMYGRTYMGIIRSAFLVGPDGLIRHAWPKISPKDTAARLAEAAGGAGAA